MKKLAISFFITLLTFSWVYAWENRDYLIDTYWEQGKTYAYIIDNFIERNKDNYEKLWKLQEKIEKILSTYNFKNTSKDQKTKAVIEFLFEAIDDTLWINRVQTWDTISVHYTGRFENWEKFDSSLDRNTPLMFEANSWQMIKGFDEWVLWMKVWDTKTIKILPKDCYGEYDNERTQTVEKSTLTSFEDAGYTLEEWTIIPTQLWNLKILRVTENEVTIDLNHELAGKTLIFEVEIISID